MSLYLLKNPWSFRTSANITYVLVAIGFIILGNFSLLGSTSLLNLNGNTFFNCLLGLEQDTKNIMFQLLILFHQNRKMN